MVGGEETEVIYSCGPIRSQRSEGAQRVKVIAAKPDMQSLVAEIHRMEGENRLLQVLLLPFHVPCVVNMCVRVHMCEPDCVYVCVCSPCLNA